MTATIISGKEVASQIRSELKQEVDQLIQQGVQPGLAVILVGDDPASHSYVKGKEKASIELNFYSEVHRLSADVSEQEVLSLIDRFNRDPKIHGILVQLPLPAHISEKAVIQAIDPQKDVDGFHPVNVGNLLYRIARFSPLYTARRDPDAETFRCANCR